MKMQVKGDFRVVKDAEKKVSKNGNEYVAFSVAYNERVKGADGNWGPLMWENPQNEYDSVGEFYDVRVFANSGGFEAAASVTKGALVTIEGRVSLRGYLRKDGTRAIGRDIAADTFAVKFAARESASVGAAQAEAAPF